LGEVTETSTRIFGTPETSFSLFSHSSLVAIILVNKLTFDMMNSRLFYVLKNQLDLFAHFGSAWV